jgi:hypothetical protein
MILDHIVALVILDTIVAFDIPLIALLMSLPMTWHMELLRNFSVLQRVHLSHPVTPVV